MRKDFDLTKGYVYIESLCGIRIKTKFLSSPSYIAQYRYLTNPLSKAKVKFSSGSRVVFRDGFRKYTFIEFDKNLMLEGDITAVTDKIELLQESMPPVNLCKFPYVTKEQEKAEELILSEMAGNPHIKYLFGKIIFYKVSKKKIVYNIKENSWKAKGRMIL
jgi:hypothetical protein